MAQDALTPDYTRKPWWWEAAPIEAEPGRESPPGRTDVAVVGGGYTGLSAALTLARGGREVVVLEAQAPGEGASTRNAGAVGRGLLGGFSELCEKLGEKTGVAMYEAAEEAYDFVISRMGELAIECHLDHRGRFLPTWNQAQYDFMARDFERQQRYLRIEGGMVSPEQMSQELRVAKGHGGLVVTNTSLCHPAEYHAGLLAGARRAGVRVIGHCAVEKVRREREGFSVKTARGPIAVKNVVLATNGYTGGESPFFRRRIVKSNAFMAATEPLDPDVLTRLLPSKRIYIDYSRHMFNYWRVAPDDPARLLFGGQTGLMFKSPEALARLLRADVARIYPELASVRFTHLWQGVLGFTMDRLPHLGTRDGVHFALGCNGSGLPLGTYIGHKIALQLMGDREGATPFDNRRFPLSPGILGYSWYMPLLTAWARWQDARGVAATGH